jgi:hypothetical protein
MEEFVPCESHQADYDFALIYVESLSVIGAGGRAFILMGKVFKKECCWHAAFSAFGIILKSYMKCIKAISLQAWQALRVPDG